jgi:protein TonB
MKRFFFVSIFFHGALLLILFFWEIPQAGKLFPRGAIEVSLIQPLPASFEKREAKKLFKKKEILPPAGGQEEQKKEEPASRKEEEKKAEPARNEDVWESKPIVARNEKPVLVEEEHPPSAHEGEEDKTLKAASNISLNLQGAELAASSYLVSTASRMEIREHEKADPQGNVLGRKVGEGSGPVSKAHPSAIELDQIQQRIIRKIEAAKRYPRAARRMGVEGTAVVRFKLKPQGQVEAVEIAESSGSEILDHASLQTVRDAAPLPYKEGWLKVGIVFKIL